MYNIMQIAIAVYNLYIHNINDILGLAGEQHQGNFCVHHPILHQFTVELGRNALMLPVEHVENFNRSKTFQHLKSQDKFLKL